MIVVTRGTLEQHYQEIVENLEILQEKGYRAFSEKSKFFEKQVDWSGYKIDENGRTPRVSQTGALLRLNLRKLLRK